MPKTETFHYTFKNSFRDVFLASWLKYPNPRRPDILASDIISKELDVERAVLTVTRLVQVKGFVPSWLQYLTSAGSVMFVLEESKTNVPERTFTMRSKNITFADVLRVEERCVYQPEAQWRNLGTAAEVPEQHWTHFEQTSAGTSPIRFIGDRIEQFIVDTAKKNISLGRDIMQEAIDKATRTHFAEL
jgi:hypothetical protein